ncbi:tubulin binding cofactor C-domain-containing protein [Scenedesmus sp. NREL 46B-D3]|nr:tubulin binding cofactor C-domain-containing protein [Scenedesmus sp. NREL 46B-D3]
MDQTTYLQPRDVVVGFGLLKVLAPELESVQAVQALHRSLASVATTGNDGNKYVTASAAAAALEMPGEQCQLLLYTLASVGGKAGTAAAEAAGTHPEEGGASIFDLSLFLMAQLYNREAQKPETQDHWPDPSTSSGTQQHADAFKAAGGRVVQPGSPGGSNSRLLVRSQIQQQQRQQQAYCRGYCEFLQRHQRVLLELVMNDSSAAEAWQQQRTATIQQHKAVQLQLQQPVQQQPGQPAPPQQEPAAEAAAVDSEMAPADQDAAGAASAAGSEAPEESMQSSPPRQTTDDGASSQQQAAPGSLQESRQQPPADPAAAARSSSGGGGFASLVRSSSAVPPVALNAAEFDRLGFLLEFVPAAGSSTAAGAAAAAADPAAGANGMQIDHGSTHPAAAGEAAGSSSSSSGKGLSSNVPGYASSSSCLMEELLAWMSASWVQEQQQQQGLVAVAAGSVGERHVSGVYRGTVVRGPGDVGDELMIDNCIECHIYVLAPVRLARITNCTDCTVCIGAVGSLLRVDSCERLQLTAAAAQVLVVSCHSCCLHLGTPRQPALLGDCRFVKLAPYNTRYETLLEHMAAAGLTPNTPSLWDQPTVIPCGISSCSGATSSGGGSGGGASPAQQLQRQRPGAATPSSPHTHGSSGGGSERRGGGLAQKPVLLMQPDEFLPLVVPFRGSAGPLAGGAAHPASTQWLPGIHKQQAGPLPPLPFPLPDAFDAALQQQCAVVSELRSRIRGSGLDEARRNTLQGCIQSFFREWLHSSGAIRQVYDLSKLEGDEYGPGGGSPPAAFRDHSHCRRWQWLLVQQQQQQLVRAMPMALQETARQQHNVVGCSGSVHQRQRRPRGHQGQAAAFCVAVQ